MGFAFQKENGETGEGAEEACQDGVRSLKQELYCLFLPAWQGESAQGQRNARASINSVPRLRVDGG